MESPLQILAQVGIFYHPRCKHSSRYTTISKVTNAWVNGYTKLHSYDIGTVMPDVLYFFEYPAIENGPRHLVWGYWSLDENGERASTMKSYMFNCDDFWSWRWEMELELGGLTFKMWR
jgi:hypothetical protein